MREALRRLESEGLVIGDNHRGFMVVEADEGSTEENFQIRAALESLGASLAAAKIDEAGVKRLEEGTGRSRVPRGSRPAHGPPGSHHSPGAIPANHHDMTLMRL